VHVLGRASCASVETKDEILRSVSLYSVIRLLRTQNKQKLTVSVNLRNQITSQEAQPDAIHWWWWCFTASEDSVSDLWTYFKPTHLQQLRSKVHNWVIDEPFQMLETSAKITTRLGWRFQWKRAQHATQRSRQLYQATTPTNTVTLPVATREGFYSCIHKASPKS